MSIYKKLHEVKKGLKYLQKDTTGHNYKYVSGSAVLGAVNPLLEQNELILKTEVLQMHTERIEVKTKYDTKIETLFTLEMRMTFVDVETGEQDINLWTSAGCNGDEKGYGSALTYAERYFFLKYFNIANDEDSPEERELKMMTDEEKQEKQRKEYETSLISSINKCSTSEQLKKYKESIPKDWLEVENVINSYNKKEESFRKKEKQVSKKPKVQERNKHKILNDALKKAEKLDNQVSKMVDDLDEKKEKHQIMQEDLTEITCEYIYNETKQVVTPFYQKGSEENKAVITEYMEKLKKCIKVDFSRKLQNELYDKLK